MINMILDHINDLDKFSTKNLSKKIYTLNYAELKACLPISLGRIQKLENYLNSKFVGMNMREVIRMMIACAIAHEPILFIGGPGLAKTELAIAFFEGIGLRKPTASNEKDNKYYEYLMSAFTLPEELFGPFKVGEGGLKDGKFIRDNTNMLTGVGIRGCFLDEIFKGSSNILNTLLTLVNERKYFNDGRFHNADLAIIIGASNSTPASTMGELAGEIKLQSKIGNELLAFYDRFTIRLYFNPPEVENIKEIQKTDYYIIREKALERQAFKLDQGQPYQFEKIANINDILLLSRVLFFVEGNNQKNFFIEPPRKEWIELFLKIGMQLARKETHLARISPRKLTRLEKIAHALALLDHQNNLYSENTRTQNESEQNTIKSQDMDYHISVKEEYCQVYKYIWENEHLREQLEREIDQMLGGIHESW